MGGHLPGTKVTEEIAAVRGFPAGNDIISPAHFEDIKTKEDLKKKVRWLCFGTRLGCALKHAKTEGYKTDTSTFNPLKPSSHYSIMEIRLMETV